MAPGIAAKRDGAIATVTLANPAKLNAITVAMWQELARIMSELSARDELRCVVIRGAGRKAFASGADIGEFARARDNVEQGRRYHRGIVFGALRAVDEYRREFRVFRHRGLPHRLRRFSEEEETQVRRAIINRNAAKSRS